MCVFRLHAACAQRMFIKDETILSWDNPKHADRVSHYRCCKCFMEEKETFCLTAEDTIMFDHTVL